ncbi:N-6 DNA methylase [Ruminococcus sp.]|uniref:N-6 DNA methylase n=1 Tax=Ruminococcus sp. TaxID=41978 RepID=UPI002600BBD6|nr:N-6 DNA methylase [Ruminococcus sp.]MCR4637626.1 N-6 DNA methylase [Ruminococcus sp.]
MVKKKYGVVYTPTRLADFVASLLFSIAEKENYSVNSILDPACGECALLKAAHSAFGNSVKYYGVDVDNDVISLNSQFKITHNDMILPVNVKKKSADYWKTKFPNLSMIIANPPWSSEKIYERDSLRKAGFNLIDGQYDSYVLFIELSFSILSEGGYLGFIIPDSLFDAQNESLRRFLSEHTQIKVVARLGEKIFDEVNRATTIIVCKKSKPDSMSTTQCFRLTTDDRRAFLSSNIPLIAFYQNQAHTVLQSRFCNNESCNFDIDTRVEEETALNKIRNVGTRLSEYFIFGRGAEIAKAGNVVVCPSCHYAQGYKKSQLESGSKQCSKCKSKIQINASTIQQLISKEPLENSVQIYVGENVHRYLITGELHIRLGVTGINYKNRGLYLPPKILVRKTGLGIYAAIDYTGSMTSQTVYILKYKSGDVKIPLEYFLAMLNSRVIYYYYLKTYGENEWKSHPYLTKQIIFSFPIAQYEASEIDEQIIAISKELAQQYDHDKDIELERIIMLKYGLSETEQQMIYDEMNRLPDLGAVNNMKVK